MRFEWDDKKNASNLRKYGIDFELAVTLFDNPFYAMGEDRVVDDEIRWKSIGHLNEKYVVVVIHTFEDEDESVIRVISAREATNYERRRYESGL